MKIKNKTAAVLSFAMLLTLCSCGSKESEKTEPPPQTTTTAATTIAVPEPVSARVTVEGTKFMVDGKEFWINGVNTPWEKWNDFGGQMDEQFWDDTFAQLAADNINCTRIWVNCNGESIVRLKTTGEIKRINELHWEELDKLFALAEKYKVYVMPTLLSFDHFKEPNGGYEKWRNLLNSDEMCDIYAETYVKEFCRRYGDNEYIFAIDIMNEPDWVKENRECGQIGFERLSYFFGKCAAAIHETSDILVTVGIGVIKYNSESWGGNKVSDAYLKELTGDDKAYLDFYSPHYYPWMKGSFGVPFDKSPADWGLDTDKPCMFGETPNDDEESVGMTLTEKYKKSYENGWRGVMVWMDPVPTGDSYEYYKYELTKEATNAMAEYIPEKIFPLK